MKIQEFETLINKVRFKINRNAQNYIEFMKVMGNNHKHNFYNQLSIYEVRRNSTACCEYDLWNDRFHRKVIKGEKGIPSLKRENGNIKVVHIFDVTQTYSEDKREFSLWKFDKNYGEKTIKNILGIENEERDILPDNLTFYLVEILNFEVRKLINANMPLAIDFGTSNTTAGMYLDDAYFEEIASDPIKNILKRNDINYLYHFNLENNIVPTLPTVIGINQIEENTIHYVFGYEATRLFQISHIEDGFSIFYDIKRFVSEPDKQEEIVDKNGYRKFINRRELIKKYLEYIIDTAKQRFKCNITHLHISAPVKQKKQFHKLFSEILPEYILENEIMLDEGVAVLYNSISDLIKQFRFEPNVQQRALIIDCGGGTTDLSLCTFSIESNRVSYKIDIETYYENSDTDFGGNNLTYRIMQLIKIALAYSYDNKSYMNINEIIKSFDIDLFRAVDNDGTSNKIYELLEKKYLEAEKIIPTR